MAAIHDLFAQIQDEELRSRIEKEYEKATKTKKFGLVFEEHLPECTPLYGIRVKRGSLVAKKTKSVDDVYEVLSIKNAVATCIHRVTKVQEVIPIEDLVCVAQFGEAIYPYLEPIDSVCNAPESELWHTLIEADNYHALQLLEYLYAEKVDCIYIDPPYNTGARDWKYNNDYVDSSDSYRHSKWLSMMQKRLKIAKKLLNPSNSVLIITIDEKEYLHLGCLLEELFPEANMQMITSVISRNGTSRENEFSRVEEYIFILRFGEMGVTRTNDNMLSEDGKGVISRVWFNFLRTSTPRNKTKGQFFPVFIDVETERIVGIGDALLPSQSAEEVVAPEGQVAVFPIRDDGTEATWGAIPETTKALLSAGFLRVGSFDNKTSRWSIQYVRQGDQKRIKTGEIIIEGKAKDGSLILSPVDASKRIVFPKTVWNRKSHDATEHGTRLLKPLFINSRFSYPKSLYAVADTLRFFVKKNKSALIVDFFAGSGTTLHAVNLLNAEDEGQRKCIMITNNEVSEDEAKALQASGYAPGDEEWEKLGIARYVTWPRTVCSIEGHDVNGNPLEGSYLNNDELMADGFRANAAFFKLGFLDKTSVALGRQLAELIPLLWMKAGSYGPCPNLDVCSSSMLIFPENRFAVLVDEKDYQIFVSKVNAEQAVKSIFIVTDSETGYQDMISVFQDKNTYQLYRDYLDNFRINVKR